ncbi:hypothetical protein ANN_23490 [Periplaneta americana]|uniref:Uncharacterized protein n=1 Tax=Periplaneta americana TaxID=6978 RepID=A0ABQ8SL84_PERAM|nr:hypothetical protein ANN_23490 [Periplaneta americana]
MSPGSNTESFPAFARIGLRENPGKNLNQITCPDRESNPGHLVSRLDALTGPVVRESCGWVGARRGSMARNSRVSAIDLNRSQCWVIRAPPHLNSILFFHSIPSVGSQEEFSAVALDAPF